MQALATAQATRGPSVLQEAADLLMHRCPAPM